MPKLSFLVLAFVAGLIGGFVAQTLFLPNLIEANIFGTADILKQVYKKSEESAAKTPLPVYKQLDFTEGIIRSEPVVVAVQAFKDNKLIRSGSGVVLTQDGLIITLNSLLPTDSDFFQVVSPAKIYRGQVVTRNIGKNLALLLIPENNLPIARFTKELPGLSAPLLVLSRLVETGIPKFQVLPTSVIRVDQTEKTFRTQTSYDSLIYGSPIIDQNGLVLALLDFRGSKPNLILADSLMALLEKYLSSGSFH
jgi:hypothetical protein